MGVPANLIYTQGTGSPPITADNLNSFCQTMTTLSGARGFSGTQNQQIFLQGYNSASDGGQGNFVWILGTGVDDGGITTIVPTGNTSGYWFRVGNSSVIYAPQTINNAAGVNLTAANLTNQVLIRSGAAAVTDTFPTASTITALFTGAQVGMVRDLLLINENSGALQWAVGAGVTFVGNLSGGNFSTPNGTQRLFKILYASPTTITVYG